MPPSDGPSFEIDGSAKRPVASRTMDHPALDLMIATRALYNGRA
jgi:hypothetical protein